MCADASINREKAVANISFFKDIVFFVIVNFHKLSNKESGSAQKHLQIEITKPTRVMLQKPLCWRHFKIIFLERKLWYFTSIPSQFVLKITIDNKSSLS